MAYATAAELRTQIEKVGTTGSGSDAALGVILDAVTKTIDQHCNRPDGFLSSPVASARYYSGKGKPYLLIDECTAITEVAVKAAETDTTYTVWTASDWQAASGDPRRPAWNSLPYNLLIIPLGGNYAAFTIGSQEPTVKTTANWGYAAIIPPAIKQATIALASRWYKQGQASWSDTLVSVELGQMIYRRENVDILKMLERFIRPAIGV